MDKIGNFLTIIRNASFAKKEFCIINNSKATESIVKILYDKGFISSYSVIIVENNTHTLLKIFLKYNKGKAPFSNIQRKSKPGCRLYYKYNKIPRKIRGFGISIITTSKGILDHKEAFKNKLGGELICQIW